MIMSLKDAYGMADRPEHEQSDLDLHCLLGPFYPKI